eukprot:gnl/TRDRNA2_/TRDRNA2_156803_c0_seq1.p1 gnl/TRDRNA2_/TRDRNA2_156803_c0~~gnl/TRDRNA2_/TRDRNA2_156803_c0_seq1.p1  ORF type:complete len:299 (+),score=46.88 gnl/TRDRNA2_/TRDRNA2_156803_c0_seq1:57-953(+)
MFAGGVEDTDSEDGSDFSEPEVEDGPLKSLEELYGSQVAQRMRAGMSYEDAEFPEDKLKAQKVQQQQRATAERQKLRECNPFGVGRWVTIDGLQAAPYLNGLMGEVVQSENAAGRLGVRLREYGSKLIKRANLSTCANVQKVCRLACHGEHLSGAHTWAWPTSILESLPAERSCLSELIGVPLNIARVEPDRVLNDGADYDNQWATFLMIDPASGFAPDDWQAYVGPVVVWRPDGKNFTADDMCLVHEFISDLLDCYPHVRVDRDVTVDKFQNHIAYAMESQRLNARLNRYDDVNIIS